MRRVVAGLIVASLWLAAAAIPANTATAATDATPAERAVAAALADERVIERAGTEPQSLRGEAAVPAQDTSWVVTLYSVDSGRDVLLVRVSPSYEVLLVQDIDQGRALGRAVTHPAVAAALTVLFVLVALAAFRGARAGLELACLGVLGLSQVVFDEVSRPVAASLSWLALVTLAVLLLARCHGLRGHPAAPDPAATTERRRASLPQLALVAVLVLVHVLVAAAPGNLTDLGYAGTAGAQALLDDGTFLYGGAPDRYTGFPHIDSYGPLLYALYAPAVAVAATVVDELDVYLVAARAVSLAGVLVCAALIGHLVTRATSTRLGLLAGAAWLAFPPTVDAVYEQSNDPLVAALLLAAIALRDRPALRGLFAAAAVATKFVPVVALAALAWHGRQRTREMARYLAGLAVVVAASVASIHALGSSTGEMIASSLEFQSGRIDATSVWSVAPHELRWVAAAGVAVVLASTLWLPRARDVATIALLTALTMTCVQLTAGHWSHHYLLWCIGPLIVGIALRAPGRATRT